MMADLLRQVVILMFVFSVTMIVVGVVLAVGLYVWYWITR